MKEFEPGSWKPAFNILNWLLLVTVLIVVISRLGTKYWIIRRWTAEDYLCIVSTAFCIGQSVAISMATAHGYGDPQSTITEADMEEIMRFKYAAAILLLGSLWFSKLSFAHFIQSVAPFHPHRLITGIMEGLISVWGVTGMITTAFQCQVPRPWDYLHSKCLNQRTLLYYVCVMSILTDMGVMAHGIYVMMRLQTGMKRKILLTIIFGVRILVVVATICQLIYSEHATNTWPASVSMQVTLCVGLITACSPQMKPFMEYLRSPGFRIDGMTTYGSSHPSYGKTISDATTARNRQHSGANKQHELSNLPPNGHHYTVTASGSKKDWDTTSLSSQAHMIHEVRTWTITESLRKTASQSSLP